MNNTGASFGNFTKIPAFQQNIAPNSNTSINFSHPYSNTNISQKNTNYPPVKPI